MYIYIYIYHNHAKISNNKHDDWNPWLYITVDNRKKAFIKKQNTFFLIARIFLSSYFAVSIKNDNANFEKLWFLSACKK